MLGIGIPGQSHTAKVNLGWFLLFTYASAYLYLGWQVTQLGLGWDSGSYKFMLLFKRWLLLGGGVDPTYVQSPRHICLKN